MFSSEQLVKWDDELHNAKYKEILELYTLLTLIGKLKTH